VARDAQSNLGATGDCAQFHDFLGERDGVPHVDGPWPLKITQARGRTGPRDRLAALALFRLLAVARQHDVTQAHCRRVPARRAERAEMGTRRRFFVEVKRLRVEFPRECLDFVRRERVDGRAPTISTRNVRLSPARSGAR
jgi:hypothetical protein